MVNLEPIENWTLQNWPSKNLNIQQMPFLKIKDKILEKYLNALCERFELLLVSKMLIVKRGYKRKYQVDGSGLFSKLKGFLSRFISKKEVVDTVLNIARNAGQKAIDYASSRLTPKI